MKASMLTKIYTGLFILTENCANSTRKFALDAVEKFLVGLGSASSADQLNTAPPDFVPESFRPSEIPIKGKLRRTKKAKKPQNLTMIQLLVTLESCLGDEVFAFHVDYM